MSLSATFQAQYSRTLPQAQKEHKDGRVRLVNVALLQLLETALHLLLDGIVKCAFRGIELAFNDGHDARGQVEDRLPVNKGRFRPPQHDDA